MNHPMISNKLGIRMSSTMQSFQDHRKILENASKGSLLGPDRDSFKISRQIPDFNAPEMKSTMSLSEAQMKEKHPLEWLAEPMRIQENPYARMNEKSIMITNFPKGVNVTKKYIHDLCLKFDPSAIVNTVFIKESQMGDNFEKRNSAAYAIVDFEMQKWVQTVRRGMRKHWEQDRLLKVKTLKDEKSESHSSRTIILSNLPSHLNAEDLATTMSEFGAITSIEAPSVDSFIQSQLEQKGLLNDVHSKERQLKKEKEYRYAQVLLNDTQTFDKQFEDLLAESWGKDQAQEMINIQKDFAKEFTKVNMLDEEKFSAFMRVMAQLQAEGVQVESSKSTLGSLANEIESQVGLNSSSKESHDDLVVEKQQQISSTLKYLLKNQESLDSSQQAFLSKFTNDGFQGSIDPIHKLQRMTINELGGAYDLLLGILKQREDLVKERLKESLKNFGREEKILHESQDSRKEMETMPNILQKLYDHDSTEIDAILGLNEQVQTININRNLPPHEKLYQWITNTADFKAEKNWNKNQLAHAQTNKWDLHREVFVPDVRQTKSDILLNGGAPSPFHEKYLKRIKAEVEKYRDEMDTPFDEIYHKERKLVSDIVRAMQSIKDIESKLPNPAANRMFDPKDIDEDPVYGDMYSSAHEPQYIRDKKLEEKMNKANLSQLKENLGETRHQYNQIEKQTIEDLIASGQINREEFEIAKSRALANRQVSLGYAFVTFSHADEAQKTLLKLKNDFYIDQRLVSVMPKGRLDHSELDQSYFMKKMKNESKLVEQKAELRESKQKLREFESNLDKELPSLKRLKDFRSIAQEMIENPKGKTRRHVSGRRTKRETEELYQKLKQYQLENPNIDVASLFENDKIDGIRRELHKRSFQSFKKFEFLKAGVEDPRSTTQKPKKELFEPFNYPPLKETVNDILTDGISSRVNFTGLPLNNPGRRFDYSEQEFLEAYLGKDFARKIDLNDNEDNHIFGFQDSLKKQFPDKNKFLKMPKLLAEQKRLEDFMGMKYEDGKAHDQKFVDYLKTYDAKEMEDEMMSRVDAKHPSDPNRTKFKDLEAQMEIIKQKAIKSGTNMYHRREVQRAVEKIEEEYKNPLEDDTHGQLHAQYAEEMAAKWEVLEEDWNQKMNELDRVLDSDEEVKEYQAALIERMSPYDTENFKIADFMAKEFPIDEESEEEVFEEKSMFDPNQKQGGEWVTATSNPKVNKVKFFVDIDDSNDISISENGFGSKDLHKRSNENLYNLQHQSKRGRLGKNLNSKKLDDICKRVTEYRRAQFNTIKAEQNKLPAEQRVPHYLDKNGMPVPHSEAAEEGEFQFNILNLNAEDAIRDVSIDEYLGQYKKFAPVSETFTQSTSEFSQLAQTYMDEKELADFEFRKNSSQKSLSDFARGEDDIYEHYKQRAQDDSNQSQFDKIKQKLQQQKKHYEEMQKIHDEANENMIDTPTFEKYFDAESKGKSAIDKFDSNDYDMLKAEEEYERIMEAEEDQSTYKRELLARMFGGKLTSRQYGVLLNMPQDQQDRERLARTQAFKTELEAKDKIRNSEEIVETFRRTKVLQGEWSEDQSHLEMQNLLDEFQAKYPTKKALDIAVREEKKKIEYVMSLRNSEQLMQREYYFDEGLGQSLNDHTNELKKKFPDLTVLTRRDRDGLPIVKIQIKPKYKYNLDEILSMDPQEMKRLQNETQEAMLEEFMPEDQKDFVYKVGQSQNFSNTSVKDGDYITQEQSDKLSALMTQRFHGKFKDDLDGFKEQLKLIKNLKGGSPAESLPAGNPFTVEGRALARRQADQELLKDQRLFEYEIGMQIALKMKDKVNFNELDHSDFIKFGRSETSVFSDQVTTLQDSMEILEKDNEMLLNTGAAFEKGEHVEGYFDEKAFKQLKAEIKRKREAKERVIQQGFPEFKPYLRL